MSGIFLEPESTFAVTLTRKAGALFVVEDGGPIVLRTLLGRAYSKALKIMRDGEDHLYYDFLRGVVVAGIAPEEIDRLHPNAVSVLVVEVLKRSHLSEEDRGN